MADVKSCKFISIECYSVISRVFFASAPVSLLGVGPTKIKIILILVGPTPKSDTGAEAKKTRVMTE